MTGVRVYRMPDEGPLSVEVRLTSLEELRLYALERADISARG